MYKYVDDILYHAIYYIMLKINQSDRDHFLKNGWVQVSMDLERGFIEECYESLKGLEQKAKDIKYPLGRIYHPHLFNDNLAAVEAPFNKQLIDDNLAQLFDEVKLGGAVRDLKKWNFCHCTLARLFTMDNYNYRGFWHRDLSGWDGDIEGASSVQVSIYLKDQSGFRIWKPEYDYWGSDPIISSNNVLPFENYKGWLPLRTNQKFYDVVEGKAGSVLFFSPGLMHQGSSSSKRLDFHMRFENPMENEKNTNTIDNYFSNTFQDFSLLNEYTYDFNFQKDSISPRLDVPSLRLKLKTSLNYYTSIINIYKLFKRKYILRKNTPYPWREDVFANTIFQSK